MVTIVGMEAAETIREAISRVLALRQICLSDSLLHESVRAVKRFQARRFALTYGDLLVAGPYKGAAHFFLQELYGDRDFSQRDSQFARIAGALQKIFPKQAVSTAVSLAEIHALTEELDHQMGVAWLGTTTPSWANVRGRYVDAWQQVGRQHQRDAQLKGVLHLGHELDRLTRTPSLRLMLKLMRHPAKSAGLSALQGFLESGFDTFAEMHTNAGSATTFLATIELRESSFIEAMFTGGDLAIDKLPA